jgi:hypothetical protein
MKTRWRFGSEEKKEIGKRRLVLRHERAGMILLWDSLT